MFIFSKTQLLVLLTFTIFLLFLSFSFISALIFMISFLLLNFCCSSFSSYFRFKVRLSVSCFCCFLRYDCIAINFPLRTTFAASHRFWVVMFSLSFVSRNFISLLISSVACWLFRNVLFNLHVFFSYSFFFSCNWYLVS